MDDEVNLENLDSLPDVVSDEDAANGDIPAAQQQVASEADAQPAADDAQSAEPEPIETPWQEELRAAAAWARSMGISDATRLGSPLTRGEYLVMRYRERGVSGS